MLDGVSNAIDNAGDEKKWAQRNALGKTTTDFDAASFYFD